MSLWKAPKDLRQQQLLLAHGVREVFVDNPSMKGRAEYGYVFFARSKSDAADFANCYGAGIIEFELERDDFESLEKLNRCIFGFDAHEVGIPYSDLDALNAMTIERRLHQ